jgi:hypothetical protein
MRYQGHATKSLIDKRHLRKNDKILTYERFSTMYSSKVNFCKVVKGRKLQNENVQSPNTMAK